MFDMWSSSKRWTDSVSVFPQHHALNVWTQRVSGQSGPTTQIRKTFTSNHQAPERTEACKQIRRNWARRRAPKRQLWSAVHQTGSKGTVKYWGAGREQRCSQMQLYPSNSRKTGGRASQRAGARQESAEWNNVNRWKPSWPIKDVISMRPTAQKDGKQINKTAINERREEKEHSGCSGAASSCVHLPQLYS